MASRRVLFVGETWNALRPVQERLREFDFSVSQTAESQVAAMLPTLEGLTLMVVEESTNQRVSPQLVSTVKRAHAIPVVWGTAAGCSPPSWGTSVRPDMLLDASMNAKEQASRIDKLLLGSIYHRKIVDSLRKSSAEVLNEAFQTPTIGGDASLAVVRTPPADVRGLINFTGPSAAGYVSVSASSQYMLGVQKHILPKQTSADPEMAKSVAAEIVNQVFGRFKGFLATQAISVNSSFPLVLSGQAKSITYRPGRISLMIRLTSAHGEVFVELCLDQMDTAALEKKSNVQVMPPGELTFL